MTRTASWGQRGRAAAAIGVSLALLLLALPYAGLALSAAGAEPLAQLLFFLPQFAFPQGLARVAVPFWALALAAFAFGAAPLRPRSLAAVAPLAALLGMLLLQGLLFALGIRVQLDGP